MPIYEYKAVNQKGKIIKGEIDGDTPQEAREKIRKRDLKIISFKEIKDIGKRNRFFFLKKKNLSELAMITRQLATLLESGIHLKEALESIVNQIEDKTLHLIFKEIKEKITYGLSFSDALKMYPYYFNELYVNMVKSGETSGELDKVLKILANYLQSQNRIRGKITAALAYPMIMMIIGVGVVLFLMTFVVPKIQNVLAAQKKELPLPTKILVNLSHFCVNWWFLIIGVIIGIIVLIKIIGKTPKGRKIFDKIKLSLPIIGALYKKQAVSRFAITFSTLLKSGVPASQSLKIVRNVVNNVVLAETLDEAQRVILEGKEISEALKKSKVFPSVVSYMISVGEKSGNLDEILNKIAEAYDEEIEITIQKVTSTLEPIMIVILSVIVGFIVLSIILPIMQMSHL